MSTVPELNNRQMRIVLNRIRITSRCVLIIWTIASLLNGLVTSLVFVQSLQLQNVGRDFLLEAQQRPPKQCCPQCPRHFHFDCLDQFQSHSILKSTSRHFIFRLSSYSNSIDTRYPIDFPTTTNSSMLSQSGTEIGKQKSACGPDNGINKGISSLAFYDQVILHVRAGSGGAGATTFDTSHKGHHRRRTNIQGSPNGGNGGRGGHVIIQADPHLNTLLGLIGAGGTTSPVNYRSENGESGLSNRRNGSPGKDVKIRVPPGTIAEVLVVENEESRWVEVGRLAMMSSSSGELSGSSINVCSCNEVGVHPTSMIVAKGGRGGDGNAVYSAMRRQGAKGVSSVLSSLPFSSSSSSPSSSARRLGPTSGQRKTVRLTLQFLADVAVIGVPNVGKSSFLAAVTRAKPTVANYAFTTIIPNLGVWMINDHHERRMDYIHGYDENATKRSKLVLCDVPGLIDGASRGAGLGIEFLRHVERCSVLLHLVDATSLTVIQDYEMINRELTNYAGGILASKPQVVVVNKIDALLQGQRDDNDDEAEVEDTPLSVSSKSSSALARREELKSALLQVMPHSRLLWMSAKEKQGVDNVMHKLAAFVDKLDQSTQNTLKAESG